MEKEDDRENDYVSKLPSSDEQFIQKFYVYKDQIENLSKLIEGITLANLLSNSEKLTEFEQLIIEVRRNIRDLEQSPPGFTFKKRSQVIQNLNKAQEELGKVQFFLGYKDSNPQAAADSVEHINPCREYLDLAVAVMTLKRR